VSFIDLLPSELITKWLSREVDYSQIEFIDRPAQERMLKAVFGNSLLQNKSRLTDILFEADELLLRGLCEKLDVSYEDKKKYDVAVELASRPFTEKSAFSAAFRKTFSVDDCYMPITEAASDAVNIIEPASSIPPAYDYQLEIIEKLKVFFSSSDRAALMQLPTGAGKTRVAVQAMVEQSWNRNLAQHSFVWLAHTQELCGQAYDTFRRMWISKGNLPIKTYRLWGGRRAQITSTQPSVIFATFGTFANMYDRSDFEELIPKLHCVVVDEAHRASSRVFGRVLKSLREQVKILGLTATPGRHADGESSNVELKLLFSANLIHSDTLGHDPIKTLQDRGILAAPKIQFMTGSNIEVFSDSTGDISKGNLQALAENEDRNSIIVDQISKLVKDGHKILVFSCSVHHSKVLVANLAVHNISASYVDADMTSARRMDVIKMFETGDINILINYGVLSTGFDVPNISAVVITRPTSSIVLYSQMLGRGMRGESAGGSNDFLVIDIRDNVESFGEVNEVYRYFDELWQLNGNN
jgi:DNA repair protein RadD